ncbi:sialidase [Thalassotalea sp. LPB0316]|uniref:WD40/YVTN/BNR-like repeat-containing protein n=1 Tax=Thalassotalea sp. LPB0316 TaxID=2769490 RepID=UPI0018678146|nr:YCF48-related protein [Thalassotalea sp. LPB0316]QOL26353.1 sialidase [Thalassotalea sp. LPB0316]
MKKRYQGLKLFCLIALLQSNLSHAQIDLLTMPSVKSHLVTKSVLTSLVTNNSQITAVGERGHIMQWQDQQNWQQEIAPVSVMLTSVTTLSDGSQIAVGHDAVILKSSSNHSWKKVFDGFELTTLKRQFLEQQQQAITELIATSQDDDEIEELEYQLEEITFSLDDAIAEQEAGPNKPLLSVTVADNDVLFALGAYGTLLKSDDKGEQWQLIEGLLDNPDKFHLNDITYSNGVLNIVGENGISFRSTDQGASWEFIELPYTGSMFGIVSHAKQQSFVSHGLQGNVLISNDLGNSWQSVDMPHTTSLLGGTMTATGDVYLVGHGGLITHFNINTPNDVSVIKHPSGSAFSDVLIDDNRLILVGQFGLAEWQLK